MESVCTLSLQLRQSLPSGDPMLLPLLLYPGLPLTHTAGSFMIAPPPSLHLFSCTPTSMLISLATAPDSQIHLYSISSSLLLLPLSILSIHISNRNYFKGLLAVYSLVVSVPHVHHMSTGRFVFLMLCHIPV